MGKIDGADFFHKRVHHSSAAHQPLTELPFIQPENKPRPLPWKKKTKIHLEQELDVINEKLVALQKEEEDSEKIILRNTSVSQQKKENKSVGPKSTPLLIELQPEDPALNGELLAIEQQIAGKQEASFKAAGKLPQNIENHQKLKAIELELAQLKKTALEKVKIIASLPHIHKKDYSEFINKKTFEQLNEINKIFAVKERIKKKDEAGEDKLTYSADDTLATRLLAAIIELQEKWKEVQQNLQHKQLRKQLCKMVKGDRIKMIEQELAKLKRIKIEKPKMVRTIPAAAHSLTTSAAEKKRLEHELAFFNDQLKRTGLLRKLFRSEKEKRKAMIMRRAKEGAKEILQTIEEATATKQHLLQEIEKELQQLSVPRQKGRIVQTLKLAHAAHEEREELGRELKNINENLSRRKLSENFAREKRSVNKAIDKRITASTPELTEVEGKILRLRKALEAEQASA